MDIDYGKLDCLKSRVHKSRNTVFFGGAGVSTESGLPDFRGAKGLYRGQEGKSAEELLSGTYLNRHPEEFFEFYRHNLLFPEAQPSRCHTALAALEDMGILRAVITQNVDGLHQKAGSHRVVELHGSAERNHCVDCGKKYDLGYICSTSGVPRCSVCGGVVRPDIVLYGEPLNNDDIYSAAENISEADVLIIGGTSLTVHPASSYISMYNGDAMAVINATPTPADERANYVFHGSIGEIMTYIAD